MSMKVQFIFAEVSLLTKRGNVLRDSDHPIKARNVFLIVSVRLPSQVNPQNANVDILLQG